MAGNSIADLYVGLGRCAFEVFVDVCCVATRSGTSRQWCGWLGWEHTSSPPFVRPYSQVSVGKPDTFLGLKGCYFCLCACLPQMRQRVHRFLSSKGSGT